jgi:hypothetical protein
MEKVTDQMRDKYANTAIKLKHNSMNIIAYRARQKIPRTWYYIREDRLYKKSASDPPRMMREVDPIGT